MPIIVSTPSTYQLAQRDELSNKTEMDGWGYVNLNFILQVTTWEFG